MIDFLAKIQAKDLVDDMYQNEYLFFKFHEAFRHIPLSDGNVGLRYDSREGNLVHMQVEWIELTGPEGQKVKLVRKTPESHAEYTERLENPLVNNCSLTKITFDNDLNMTTPSERLLELGNKALLIWDIDRFFSTLDVSLATLGFEYSRGTVLYYDHKSYDGDLSYLHKDIEYQFQNEYRILIGPNAEKIDFKIPIPDLRSMSVVIPSHDLYSYSTYTDYFFLPNSKTNGKLPKET